ncbi:MAG: hypothetical protein H0Z19_09880 [Archaeoglobus sp.]|uniref:DVU0298 family protein n=1 Tax=Archaeoglobus sp. TaxID=1872626 RepID=UPI001DA025D0|nr:DVU0298 family protein [Archaeoglobus sp.]MBO8180764.1 hypothetical protein [Archaeoglobus sp.]
MNLEELKPSKLISFLYHPEEILRFRAAEVLGKKVKGEKARNLILRLFWHLNDESGAYCVGAPLGIAEIGRNNPDVFEGFKNKYVSLLDDSEVERKYVAYGIDRLAEIVKDAYPNPAKKLREKIDEVKDNEFTVYALIALKKLGDDISDLQPRFNGVEKTVEFYDGKEMVRVAFCEFLVV